MSSKLRILCLHGFTSNGQVHQHQLRHVVRALPDYEFLFPSAPHEVEITTQMDMNEPANQSWVAAVSRLSTVGHRAWFFAKDGNATQKSGLHGLETSLGFIGDYIEKSGPIHAICGFSQGAAFAAMLNALLQHKHATHPLRKHLPAELPTPRAGVIFSGFRARWSQYDSIYEPRIDVPLLHVIGRNDSLVKSERGQALFKICNNSRYLEHDGGHNIPDSEEDRATICAFLRSHLSTDDVSKTETRL